MGIEQRIESVIEKILHTADWSGGRGLQTLLDTHRLEHTRKWGLNGVFRDLLRFYPERRQEINRDKEKHIEILEEENGFEARCETLRQEGRRRGRASTLRKTQGNLKSVNYAVDADE